MNSSASILWKSDFCFQLSFYPMSLWFPFMVLLSTSEYNKLIYINLMSLFSNLSQPFSAGKTSFLRSAFRCFCLAVHNSLALINLTNLIK